MIVNPNGEIPAPPNNRSFSPPSNVAFVIPARNRSDLLAQCLASIEQQEFRGRPLEVIICDDGSTENLSFTVEAFRGRIPAIRLLRQEEPKGPAAARNLGFRSSLADIFICVDSDIICAPGFLAALIAALEAHPDWVAAEATVLSRREQPSVLLDAPQSRGGAFLSGASAYRREALQRAGGFDEEFLLPACEDVDLAMRLLKLGRFGYVPGAVSYHPARRVSWRTHWRWRKHWKYEMILAKRYGILAFPGRLAGRFPRLRVALAAVVNLPAGRFIQGIGYLRHNRWDGIRACLHALFDVCCGLWALPTILFAPVPSLHNYLRQDPPTRPAESERLKSRAQVNDHETA
jgi:GT2 family glycosyltransferase